MDKTYNYFPKSKDELKELLKKLIEERGYEGDFNDIDTSAITDMSQLFSNNKKFNGDISKWNTSNVPDMRYMY
jgi:surface protein